MSVYVNSVLKEDRLHVTPLKLAIEKQVPPMVKLVREAARKESEQTTSTGNVASNESKEELLKLLDATNDSSMPTSKSSVTSPKNGIGQKKTEIVGLTMNVMGRKMRIHGPRVHPENFIPEHELRKVYRK